jgi:hypothetical protein
MTKLNNTGNGVHSEIKKKITSRILCSVVSLIRYLKTPTFYFAKWLLYETK